MALTDTIKAIINPKEAAKTQGKKRSSQWPATRRAHLARNPSCAVCGSTKGVQVHHIRPFHLHPELELEPSNLISLCENGNKNINCHLVFGHLGSFKDGHNENILNDAQSWNEKLKSKKNPLPETTQKRTSSAKKKP